MDETTVGSQYLDWRRWGPANSDISLNLTQLNSHLVELKKLTGINPGKE
jgi:hypothetical protein